MNRTPVLTTGTVAVLLSVALLSGCAELKQAGRTIGHTSRDVTRDIGHATRDVTREIGHGTRRVVSAAAAESDSDED
jgi:hypothetical protein